MQLLQCMWLLWPWMAISEAGWQECTKDCKNDFGDFIVSYMKDNYSNGVMVDDIIVKGSLKNKVQAKFGVMKGMKSLLRYGDVILDTEGIDIQFKINVTLKKLIIDYEQYKFTALGFAGVSSGSMTAISENSIIELKCRISRKSICYIEVVEVILHKLDEFTVEMKSRNKISQNIGTRIGNTILRFYKNQIRFNVHILLINSMPKVIRPNRYICRHLRDNY